jgi:hypothetical protein
MQRLLTVARVSARTLSKRRGPVGLSNPSVLQTGANRGIPFLTPRRLFQSISSMSPSLNGSSVADDDFQAFGNFDLVKRIKLDYTDVVVSKWQSRVTGLTVVHLDYEGIHCLILDTFVIDIVASSPCQRLLCCWYRKSVSLWVAIDAGD